MTDKEKYDSDTLRQQKKAREEFLELKRIQNGEVDAPHPQSACEKQSYSVKEKSKNIWYYYRWPILTFIFLAVVVAILVKQCASKTDYDLTVTVYTSNYISDNYCESMSSYFEKYCDDVNGDGKINVQVINCSYNGKDGSQTTPTNSTKIQAILVAEYNAMLFITDDTTYDFLNSINDSLNIIETDGVILGDAFYKNLDNDSISTLPENLKISRRAVSDTTMQSNKKAVTCYQAAGKLLNSLSE